MLSKEEEVFSPLLQLGKEFELDLDAVELRKGDQAVRLGRIPMELLLLLVERRGKLVTREQIIERVWGKDVFLDRQQHQCRHSQDPASLGRRSRTAPLRADAHRTWVPLRRRYTRDCAAERPGCRAIPGHAEGGTAAD